jgi:hypothetical protein
VRVGGSRKADSRVVDEHGVAFRVLGLGFRVSGFGFRVSGFGFRVSGFGFRVSGSEFRVQGLGFTCAPKLTDLYRKPSMSTWEKSVNPSEAELGHRDLRLGFRV